MNKAPKTVVYMLYTLSYLFFIFIEKQLTHVDNEIILSQNKRFLIWRARSSDIGLENHLYLVSNLSCNLRPQLP